MMPGLSYEVKVDTPCVGTQTVAKISDTFYSGTTGDFTSVNMGLPPGESAWEITIYNYGGVTGCTTTSLFGQVTADANDPEGEYGLLDSNGDPDTSLGELNVTEL